MDKNFITLKVENLVKADWNYKKDDEWKRRRLYENIKRNGQIENLIVRELDGGKYEVVNENHRYDVLAELDVKEIVCYNLGRISTTAAKRIAIETNETRFESNFVKLAELVEEVCSEFGEIDSKLTMPFTDEELQNFSNLIEFDWKGIDTDSIKLKAGKYIFAVESDNISKLHKLLKSKDIDQKVTEDKNVVRITL